MKFPSKLFIFFCYLALSTPAAFANIYRIILDNYTINPAVSDVEGVLEGYIDIDETIALANASSYLDTSSTVQFASQMPWITAASFTFTRTSGDEESVTVTKTLESTQDPIFMFNWRVKQTTADAGGLDFSSPFVDQMQTFGVSNFRQFTGNPDGGFGSKAFIQQFYESEALLEDPINSVAVPGPLPILGIAPLAWYFRKLKNKSLKS